jgi:hypothetical protein
MMAKENISAEDRFCNRCGTKLVERIGKSFDVLTGERITHSVCPSCFPCDHEFVPRKWWQFGDFKCTKCGVIEHNVY